ncbi:hypothetical protein [Hufsiella ginkgonis]|uniref:Uncharacterized protein n=1 Tax=Hufsiella ginkgonis TaxID=2695274 RepID=A0A7K1XSQ3_9SPHI|nr:hypothetical protein [Hufsiella ginkgonis]MXV13940.1 hypothetical protein [Hufsiella ginkgonis]
MKFRRTRPVVITFILCLVSLRGVAQDIYTALHMNEMRDYRFGKPMQITETNTFYDGNASTTEKSVKRYDRSGMLVTEERYSEDGTLKAKLSYHCDTARRLHLQRVFERWSSLGYAKETAVYTYDEKDCLVQVTDQDAEGNRTRLAKIVNNERGDPVELRLFDHRGMAFGMETAKYDYDKNIAVTSLFSNDGNRLSGDTLIIDFGSAVKNGNHLSNDRGDPLTSSVTYASGKTYVYEHEYQYDVLGNCTGEKVYKVTSEPGRPGKKRKIDRVYKKRFVYY